MSAPAQALGGDLRQVGARPAAIVVGRQQQHGTPDVLHGDAARRRGRGGWRGPAGRLVPAPPAPPTPTCVDEVVDRPCTQERAQAGHARSTSRHRSPAGCPADRQPRDARRHQTGADRAHDGADVRERGADEQRRLPTPGATERRPPGLPRTSGCASSRSMAVPNDLQRQLHEGRRRYTGHPEVRECQHAEAVRREERGVDLVESTLGAAQQQHARMWSTRLGVEQHADDSRCRHRDALHADRAAGRGVRWSRRCPRCDCAVTRSIAGPSSGPGMPGGGRSSRVIDQTRPIASTPS